MIDRIKIISGGQSGVDRAALDFALQYEISCGGWCPKGRLAEDGVIDQKYPLKEAPDSSYFTRTNLNVRDSDGTLILYQGKMDEGTKLTHEFAEQLDKPIVLIEITNNHDINIQKARFWIKSNQIKILNIAGPRESNCKGIYDKAIEFLISLFQFL